MTHVIPSATLQRCNTSITQIDGQPLKKQRAVMVDRSKKPFFAGKSKPRVLG
jgi:hypothetical protein